MTLTKLSELCATRLHSKKVNIWAIIGEILSTQPGNLTARLYDDTASDVLCYIDVGTVSTEKPEAKNIQKYAKSGLLVRLHRVNVFAEAGRFVLRLRSSFCNGSVLLYKPAAKRGEIVYTNFSNCSFEKEDEERMLVLGEIVISNASLPPRLGPPLNFTLLSNFKPKTFCNLCVHILRLFKTNGGTHAMRVWDGTDLNPEMTRQIGQRNLTLSLIPESEISEVLSEAHPEVVTLAVNRCVDITIFVDLDSNLAANSFVELYNVDYRQGKKSCFLRLSSNHPSTKIVIPHNAATLPHVVTVAERISNLSLETTGNVIDFFHSSEPTQLADELLAVSESRQSNSPDKNEQDISNTDIQQLLKIFEVNHEQHQLSVKPLEPLDAELGLDLDHTVEYTYARPGSPSKAAQELPNSVQIVTPNKEAQKNETRKIEKRSPTYMKAVTKVSPSSIQANNTFALIRKSGSREKKRVSFSSEVIDQNLIQKQPVENVDPSSETTADDNAIAGTSGLQEQSEMEVNADIVTRVEQRMRTSSDSGECSFADKLASIISLYKAHKLIKNIDKSVSIPTWDSEACQLMRTSTVADTVWIANYVTAATDLLRSKRFMQLMDDRIITWAVRCNYCFEQVSVEKASNAKKCFCSFCFSVKGQLNFTELIYRVLVPVWFIDENNRNRIMFLRIDNTALQLCDDYFFHRNIPSSVFLDFDTGAFKTEKLKILDKVVDICENYAFLPNKCRVRAKPSDDYGPTLLLDVLDCRVRKSKT